MKKGQKMAVAGTAVLVAEPVLALAHTGGAGVLVGLAAGAVAYLIADEIHQTKQAVEGEIPRDASHQEEQPVMSGPRSLVYRLLNGKSVREEAPLPLKEGEQTWQRHNQPSQITLSPDLSLDLSELICKAIFIVGQRRSGKTTLGALLAELMGKHHVPLFIPDSEGDLLSVCDLLPRGVIAAAPGSRWENAEDANLWIVTPEDADALGFQILYEGLQVILDMSSFANDDDAWQIVVGVIDGLFAYAKEYPDQLCPVEVFLDEAQKYLPQDLNTSAIRDPGIRDALLEAYRDVSGTGGKRGITPVILSQRFAETNNKIIAQSELRFILRQTQDNDLERCKKYVRAETATPQEIASFSKGQGVFVGEDGTQLVTTFYQRQSDGSRSGTPDVEALERFKHAPLTLQRPASRAAHRDEKNEPEENHPRSLRLRPLKRPDPLLVRAVDAWLGGANSIDKLAAALDVKPNVARGLRPRVLAEIERREQAEMEEIENG